MKIKTVRTLHPMVFGEFDIKTISWVLSTLNYSRFELPEYYTAALLNIRPHLIEDGSLLLKKITVAEPEKNIMLNDAEMYALYMAYNLFGRLLASSWRDEVMHAFRKDRENLPPPAMMEKYYRLALVNVDPMLKRIATYARQEKCLKELPEIRRMLKRLPVLD